MSSESCVTEANRVPPGTWSCVVERHQVWISPEGTRYSVASVAVTGLGTASVALEPIFGGERRIATARAMCQGGGKDSSGAEIPVWTRLPDVEPPKALPKVYDPEEGETEIFGKTHVGLGPLAGGPKT